MESVQNIRVENHGLFMMNFLVTNGEFSSDPTPEALPLASQTIDLAATTFAVGDALATVINPMLGQQVTAADRVSLALNGRTAVYTATGTAGKATIKLTKIEPAGPVQTPPNWPAGIPVNNVPFGNWDGTITVTQIWTCAPSTADDVVTVCNWAVSAGWLVRPRGIKHNWSPLSLASGLPADPKILLIDFTKSLNAMTFLNDGNLGPRVKVGTGATMGDLLAFLQEQPGGGANVPGTGWSLPHIPAPDHLTVGGVLAINGHGTAIPNPLENWKVSYGSMSNRILELTAVVTDPGGAPNYRLMTFQRGTGDTPAFLTHLGRALVVDATLQVIPNYNLRCQSYIDIDWQTLFAMPAGSTPPPKSLGDFLNQTGRVEAIWFPFSNYPWLKVWSNCPSQPQGSRLVTTPDNYTFSDTLPDWVTALVKEITSVPGMTPVFGKAMQDVTSLGLTLTNTMDLWGASKNTLFYVKDTTLRVTANGYAIRMNKADVQKGIAQFAAQYNSLLAKYAAQGKYPVNSPLEIRITGLDTPENVPAASGASAGRPVISSLSADATSEGNNWDVALWLDVLTLPGTADSNEFYTELEAWFSETFQPPYARVMPEWSKGWAYTNEGGAWTSGSFMENVRNNFTNGRNTNDNWAWEVATLTKYDAKNLFQSPLTSELFVDPSTTGKAAGGS